MTFVPFHIRCTTCEAKLAVRGPALLGQLLACPKCGSMVQIPNQLPAAKPDSAEVTPPTPPIAPIAEAPPVLPSVTAAVTGESEPLIPKRPRHASANSSRIILSIVLLSVVFLLGALYAAVLLRSSPEEPPRLQPPQPPQVIVEPPEPLEEPLPSEDNDFDDPVEIVEIEEEESDPSILEKEDFIDEELPDLALLDPQPPDLPPLAPQPIRSRAAIDVSERLKLPIAGLKAESTTLYDAATLLADCAGVPLTWDVPGMRLFGISLETPLRLDFGESTVGELLSTLLSQNQLAMLAEFEQIFIYPIAAADPTLHEVRYAIADLGALPQMAEMIPGLIAPFSWKPLGGTGSLEADATTLVVHQTEMNHRETARFLEMVRDARNIPLLSTAGKSPLETERILKELFPERYCEKTLDRPLSLHYMAPTPLEEIFRVLEPVLQLRFLVNHRTLNEVEIPFKELKGTVRVEKGTVREAMTQLLHSVDQVELTYRIVDWNTVEIITREAALLPEYGSLESHHYGAALRRQSELSENNGAEEMIAMLKNTIETDSWAEMTPGGGAVLVDHASETFFIRQSQPVQRIVYEWLLMNHSPLSVSP